MRFLRLVSRVTLLGLLLSACVKQPTAITPSTPDIPIATTPPLPVSTEIVPPRTKPVRLATVERTPPMPVDPTPTATTKPTATIVPPASLSETVANIINNLNTHQHDGYSLSDQFFTGIYGVGIVTDTTRFFSSTDLLMSYAGDQYGLRELALRANPDTPLPTNLRYTQALALNPTEKVVAAIVLSTGWGVEQQGEALLYFTQQEGEYKWIGAVFSFDGFATPVDYPLVELPDKLRAYLTEEATIAALKRQLAKQFHTDERQLSINPAHSTAVIAESSHQSGIYKYHVVDIVSGERTSYQGEFGRALFVTDNWLDDQQLVIKYQTRDNDYPLPGQLAILDTATGKLVFLDEKVYVYERLSITPDGAIVYPKREHVGVWQNGVETLIDVRPILDTGGNKQRSIISPAISADQRYVIAVTRIGEEVGYVLLDTETNQTTVINKFTAPGMDGTSAPAIWNSAGSWAVLSAWTIYADQRGVILVEAATGETRHLGINSAGGQWINDELLLFRATVNGERQAFLYNVSSGERVRVQIDQEAVREEGVSAEILTQDIVFPAQKIRLKIPADWQPSIAEDAILLHSPTKAYTVWSKTISNLGDLPLTQLYDDQYSPDLVAKFVNALSIERVGYRELVRSDFVFSAENTLAYFYKGFFNYTLLALSPYDTDKPSPEQAEIVTVFEAMAASVDIQFMQEIDSAGYSCPPITTNDESPINVILQPTPCIVWR
ncbi:MAG TPA: hypothetical protein ENJ56_08865, partial [Anaerolineae bacterium]|nr:hypothetical protein [Anaerolineae bacterium]